MTLQKTNVSIPIKGLNTGIDPKSAEPGECIFLENMFFHRTTRGGAELKKRYGGAALTKAGANFGPTVAAGRKLAVFNDERLLVEGDLLRSYSPTLAGWSDKRAVSPVGLTLEHVSEMAFMGQLTGGTGCQQPDVAISGNLMAMAWVDTSTSFGVHACIIDRNTGVRVFQDTSIDGGVTSAGWVRVIALASVFMFVCSKGSTNQITVSTIAYSNLAWSGGSTVVASDLNASCKGDAIRNGANDSVLVAYHTTAPGLKVLVINSNKTAGSSATSANVPDQAIGWLHWDFSDGNAYLGYVGAAVGLKYASTPVGATPALTVNVADAATTTAAQVTGFRSGTTVVLYVELRASPTYNTRIVFWSSQFGGAVTGYVRSVGIGARVFKVGAKYYMPFAYESPLQNCYFVALVDGTVTAPSVVARPLYGLGGGLSARANVGQPQVLADGLTVLVPVLRRTSKLGATLFFGAAIAKLDFGGTGMSSPKRIGDNLHIPGGFIRAYAGDGTTSNVLAELGFFLFPEKPTLAQSAGAGALTLLGTYQYTVVYAFTDAQGQIHRSAPSEVASITLTGANNTVAVTFSTLRISGKRGMFGTSGGTCTAEVYASQNGGTTFYRISSQSLNDPAFDTSNTNDLQDDTAKGANERLYTTGGVLPHMPPPSAKLMEAWHNRLFLAGTENPNELWVSNEYRAGEGVSFSDALVIAMETEGGPITALAEMDDRLLIFKRGAIYALAGNGPSLTGDGQFDQPIRVSSAVGAVSQAGVIKARDGVLFVSPRGIYMYARNGQTVFVGAGVDTYSTLTITGACVLEDEEQVRFVSAEGTTLVYHYGLTNEQGIGRWTTFSNQAAVDCIVWNRVFARLASDGTVVEETPGAWADPGGAAIYVIIRTAWLFLTQWFGRFRLHRVLVEGNVRASINWTWNLYYDLESTAAETETNAISAATDHPLEINPARRRCASVHVQIEENSATEGFTVTALGLEVAVEPGRTKTGLEHNA